METGRVTVLIVDDEPIVLNFACRVLERAGYDVVAAHDGQEALEVCRSRQTPIGLLLTDINMPRVNGVELAKCLTQTSPQMPIVFMTGYKEDSAPMRMLTSTPGLDGHMVLRKPFRSQDLLIEVESLLKSSAEQRRVSQPDFLT